MLLQNKIKQAMGSWFSIEEKRGRYMAISALGWVLPNTFVSLCGGWMLDQLNPQVLWIGRAVPGFVLVRVYLPLHGLGGQSLLIPDLEFRFMYENDNN